jgi:hypothetical protein
VVGGVLIVIYSLASLAETVRGETRAGAPEP